MKRPEILSDEKLITAYGRDNPIDDHIIGCRRVAEIAYKAGYTHALEGVVIEGGYESAKRQGRREVVDFVKQKGIIAIASRFVELTEWQAFLEENGIEWKSNLVQATG